MATTVAAPALWSTAEIAGPSLTASASISIDLAAPEPPAALAEIAYEEPRPALSSSAALFSPFALDRTALSLPAVSIMAQPGEARPDEPASFREVVREEIAGRDPSLARLMVRPPPRPAFIEVRQSSATEPGGIVDVTAGARAPQTFASAAPPELSWWPTFAPAQPGAPRPGHAERGLQNGIASWYGPGFHGRRTASGEVFNQNAMTAAHRTLPFGSRVKVVDQKTGRSVVVRINDRGPFKPGRVIDLSKLAAQELGMGGLGQVKLVSAE